MKYGRLLMWSVLAAAPVLAMAGYELTAAGQGAPVTGAAAAPAVAPAGADQATLEMRIELKKAQIQAALSEKIAQVKEEEFKGVQAKYRAGSIGEEVFLTADLDAVMARAGAEVAKLNMTSVDTQLRSGPAGAAQDPNKPATQTTIQLLRLEAKKAQIQLAAAGRVAEIRQKQYDREATQLKAGQSTAERVSDAMLDLEAARATAEIAKLDVELMDARVSAATGGGRR